MRDFVRQYAKEHDLELIIANARPDTIVYSESGQLLDVTMGLLAQLDEKASQQPRTPRQ